MGLGKAIEKELSTRRMTIKELSALADIPYNTLYACIKRDSDSLRMDYYLRILKIFQPDDPKTLELEDAFAWGKKYLDEYKQQELLKTEEEKTEEERRAIIQTLLVDILMSASLSELEEIKKYAEFLKSKRVTEPDKK